MIGNLFGEACCLHPVVQSQKYRCNFHFLDYAKNRQDVILPYLNVTPIKMVPYTVKLCPLSAIP